ncbi:DUF1801 domain-containing protein [Litorilinea aerophila]|uniref:DUF1801 domain-containing protein n=1 Tax=Litorilinea aerophila TaxID=1204385 RepID=A0A540VLM5_9CHLR|nr:DUF1801 domain-containing protein [Litorilinea aerophila]MCC9074883.1 DUF1801 domain-containing protein [Litorilinea aerophila]OUC06076.1 hypothetical protein RY27_23260 [Litorilinea aerophila]GIV76871.1 MAG: hypothetical protein KatS3mg050_1265 [Litorilinea sp.]
MAAALKTRPTDGDVEAYLQAVPDPGKREDCFRLLRLMTEVTGEKPVLWGDSIVGFGRYHYRYASGHEGDWMLTGFAPRKQALTVYIMAGFDQYGDLLARLGKFKTGKSCLYLRRLDDVDLDVLAELVRRSVAHMSGR